MSSRRFPYPLMSAYVPRRFLICLVSGWFPATPHCRGPPDSLCPSHGTHQGPLQNRTALFNIASIFCLSMLFSKNSRRFLPDPFEKNTSQHPQHCPIPRAYSQRSLPLIQPRRIKRVIFNIAHFCALSNTNPKFFRFFFEHGPTRTTAPVQLPLPF